MPDNRETREAKVEDEEAIEAAAAEQYYHQLIERTWVLLPHIEIHIHPRIYGI